MTPEHLLTLLVALFVSTAVHEYGHAAMARLLSMPIDLISVGIPDIGLGFRSKRFRSPVRIGPLPFYGFVRLKPMPPNRQRLSTAFALAGPQASLALGWFALGLMLVLFQGFEPVSLAIGAVLTAAGVLFALRPGRTLPAVVYAAMATAAALAFWGAASLLFGSMTAPRTTFLHEFLYMIGIISTVTGVGNLTTFFKASDGALAERRGGPAARHVRYVNHATVAMLAIIAGAALYVAFSG